VGSYQAIVLLQIWNQITTNNSSANWICEAGLLSPLRHAEWLPQRKNDLLFPEQDQQDLLLTPIDGSRAAGATNSQGADPVVAKA
jgi:hypothetical protein